MFLHEFLNIKQDSHLRGNDGISYFQAAVSVLQRFQPEKGGRKKNRAGWMARFFVWGRYGAGWRFRLPDYRDGSGSLKNSLAF
ncbi:hypothetical protein [Kingella sp. (in: b-proteobacteria)]|uniref:hypothetical protein n=1 Tax=Kingella sp. (in: b-proteobacteria) TaxID=2020713 RepID=UPI0026DAF0F8|nr:hypothetical protein [Kingella sp. (in: b-proteobacteria)]MDO4657713.1 hypothetical protein [Kingella sp. (in: b-proteobacteria)]